MDFGREVRPILAKNCLVCHGFDPSTREADLRLDTFEGATAERSGERPPAIVPGDPDASLLMRLIQATDPEERMPAEGEPLKPAEIDVLRRWIAQDAAYAAHWSLRPVEYKEPPAVGESEWERNPIDAFIRAKQIAAGLEPAPEADRRALIRRLSVDLTGILPAPEEVEAFEGDRSPKAYERLVDRLLASPRYGERWARHWLDLMRYAETYAHEYDYPIRHAWRYRDYVIRALNADVPYDRFVTEHIAGDLLPEPRRHPTEEYNESIIGTGFWWLSQGTHAPVDVRHDEAERIDNQIDVLSKAFLATTVSCARCHDHKFDPVYTKEYYSLAGFIQSSRRQEAYLDPGGKIGEAVAGMRRLVAEAEERHGAAARARLERDAGEVSENLLAAAGAMHGEAAPGEAPADLARWVAALQSVDPEDDAHPLSTWLHGAAETRGEPDGVIAGAPRVSGLEGLAGPALFDFTEGGGLGDWFVSGWAFGDRPSETGEWVPLTGGISELRCADSGRLSARLMGTMRSQTFEIVSPYLVVLARGKGVLRVIIDGYTMDEYNALIFDRCRIEVGSAGWSWHVHDLRKYVGHRAHYEIIDDSAEASLQVALASWSDEDRAPAPVRFDAEILAALGEGATLNELAERHESLVLAAIRGDGVSPAGAALTAWLVGAGLLGAGGEELAPIRERMAVAEASCPEPVRVFAMEDGTGEDEYVFIRGSHRNRGETAPRGFIGAICADPTMSIPEGSGRLQLAAKLLDESNPLPTRVVVNRVWHHLFGRGIVETTDDFGLLGKSPTHPELLDHLAWRFRSEMAWSVKALIREVVLSRTYRLASAPHGEEAALVDPLNTLWTVRDLRRLDGESLRDSILAASGQLDETLYGPSVPVQLTPFMTGRGRPGESGPVDGDRRRSIYLEVRRNFLNPMMQTFDAPVAHSTMGRRVRSNVPAQSLILLNDPFVVEQAEKLAERILTEEPVTQARIDRLYRLALGRAPAPGEAEAAESFIASQAEAQRAASQAGSADPELRAWADLCHVVLNLKEFSFIE